MTNGEKLERVNQGLLGRFWRRLGRVGYCLAGFSPIEAQRRGIEQYNKAMQKRAAYEALINPPVIGVKEETYDDFKLKILRLQNTVDVYRVAGKPYEMRITMR